MDKPKTIHDFGGFPQELFDQQYPAPGDPAAARAISQLVRQRASAPLGLDESEWGLDHGAWSVLKPMFPDADIPVIQLSMDYGRAPEDHYALAKQLKALRDRGVLIVASGNIVHNLRQMQRGATGSQAYDWALEFDQTIGGYLQQGNLDALQNFQKLGQVAKMAHPPMSTTCLCCMPQAPPMRRSRCAFSTPASRRGRSRCARRCGAEALSCADPQPGPALLVGPGLLFKQRQVGAQRIRAESALV
jgi:aromatic ring-opening dioxygenase catalytic subunit (LigB family)